MGLAIDVVVPTHNGWPHTRDCLHHLRAQTAAHRVIVADDGSSDGTPERVAHDFPEVGVRPLGANRGFAAACNAGARAGSGDVVVLLNNDVDARPAFLEALVAPLAGDRALGSCAALLVRPGGGLIDSVGLTADPTLAGFPRHQGLPVTAAGREAPALLGPSGGAAAYRREAWEAMGGLDEAIFLYQEDLDLALRLRAGGWGAAAAIEAAGVHHGSATTGRASAFQRRHAGFSRGYLLRRYRVLRSRSGPRALLTEALVSAGDIAFARDLAAVRGRLAGWRAGKSAGPLPIPREGLEPGIGLRESLRLRGVDVRLAGAGLGSRP